eukprot:scaffold169749_cov60-Cyclotella_meneghiniana.AAC.4
MLLVPRDRQRGGFAIVMEKLQRRLRDGEKSQRELLRTSLTKIFPFRTSQQEVIGKLKRAVLREKAERISLGNKSR